MFIDGQNQFCEDQAFTATGASTNYIDTGAVRNVGVGQPMCVVITTDVAPVATGTYLVALQTASASSFASPVQLGSVTIGASDPVNTKYIIPLPEISGCLEFLRLNVTVGGTSPSVTFSAELLPTNMLQNDAVFPAGYTIK